MQLITAKNPKRSMSKAAVVDAGASPPDHDTLANQKKVAALSQVRPDARTDGQIDSLVQATRHIDAFANLSVAEHHGLARVWTHDMLGSGESLCRVNEQQPAYFIVVSGAMEVESQRLCHNLQENAVTPSGVSSANSMRTTVVGVGKAFGQLALLHDSQYYDYSAKAASCGCGLLRVGKNHYAGLLRRHEEKELGETVRMLRASPFFSGWTVAALERLYYVFERRRLQPGEDVVTQGDIADFCFFIASGRCDIVITVPPSVKTGNLEATERFVTQLPTGTLVGEAGLLSETGLRNATVRATGVKGKTLGVESRPCEVLVLSKESFLELDEATLEDIRDTAEYNSACNKEPHVRTEADLELLRRRTAHLDYCKQLPPFAQHELCRVMRFRKFEAGGSLYERGGPATKMFVIISGTAGNYAAGHEREIRREEQTKREKEQKEAKASLKNVIPKIARRHTIANAAASMLQESRAGQNGGRLQSLSRSCGSIDATATAAAATAATTAAVASGQSERNRPTSVLEPGDVAGEGEFLFGETQHATSLVAITDLCVMEVERDDFEQALKPHRAEASGGLYSFLEGIPSLAGLSAFELHALGKLAVPRAVTEGQLCLASVPNVGLLAALGAIPYSRDTVYIIRSGEARLLCALEESVPDAPADGGSSAGSGVVGAPVLANRALEAALGKNAPLATLGPTEVISTDLLSGDASVSDAPWCLQPRAHTELLLFPRREWDATIRTSASAKLRDLAVHRATFLQQRLEDARREAAAICQLGSPPCRRGGPTSPAARRLRSMPNPMATPHGGWQPESKDQDGSLSFVNGVPAVERPAGPSKASSVLRASDSALAMQHAAASPPHKKGLYGHDQAGRRPRISELRRDLEAQKAWQHPQHAIAAPPRPGTLPAIGSQRSTPTLVWRDGIPVYAASASRPASPPLRSSAPLAASPHAGSAASANAARFPEESVDWHALDESTMPIGDSELELRLGQKSTDGTSSESSIHASGPYRAGPYRSRESSGSVGPQGNVMPAFKSLDDRTSAALGRNSRYPLRSTGSVGAEGIRPKFTPTALPASLRASGQRRSKSYGMVPTARSHMAEASRLKS